MLWLVAAVSVIGSPPCQRLRPRECTCPGRPWLQATCFHEPGLAHRAVGLKSCDEARTIYANDNYGMWTSDFKALWKRCAELSGPPGLLAKAITPRAKDFSLLKPRHSAFYSTPLDILLTQLQCKRLVITGLAADSCVLFSAMDAYLRGYPRRGVTLVPLRPMGRAQA